jgi:hypothetical protein
MDIFSITLLPGRIRLLTFKNGKLMAKIMKKSISTKRSLYPKPLQHHDCTIPFTIQTLNSLKINDYYPFLRSSVFPSDFSKSLDIIGSPLKKVGKKYHFPCNFPVIIGNYYAICGTLPTILCFFWKSSKSPRTLVSDSSLPLKNPYFSKPKLVLHQHEISVCINKKNRRWIHHPHAHPHPQANNNRHVPHQHRCQHSCMNDRNMLFYHIRESLSTYIFLFIMSYM